MRYAVYRHIARHRRVVIKFEIRLKGQYRAIRLSLFGTESTITVTYTCAVSQR